VQPLTTDRTDAAQEKEELAKRQPVRRRLPEERESITHKFVIGDHEGYLTTGLYPDGTPGEIFMVMAKEGTVVSGLSDCFATAISLALQYGVPLKVLVDKFSHTRFEPSGFTHHPQIRYAKSIADYIFRWMAYKFLNEEDAAAGSTGDAGAAPPADAAQPSTAEGGVQRNAFLNDVDAPPCPECGSLMTRNGSCYRCLNCGATSGCS
jgi:ribonucleoside-diphosphate reductase alpha chain